MKHDDVSTEHYLAARFQAMARRVDRYRYRRLETRVERGNLARELRQAATRLLEAEPAQLGLPIVLGVAAPLAGEVAAS